jgi:TrmH family RNA methyltransferase
MADTLTPPEPKLVLSRTSHPGNIGAAARAMKTMGQRRLYLVNPLRYPSADATARASGADDVLEKAVVCASLEEAIQDVVLVLGASARLRSLHVPVLTPREAAALIAGESEPALTAVLFGNEQSGLSNEELDRCHYLVQIPSNPDYSSLNLAAALQVICYELRCAALSGIPAALRETGEFATLAQVERFYSHLEKVLIEIGFLDPDNPRYLMRRLRRLFARVRLDQNEVNILRGILTAVEKSRSK